MNTKAVLVPDLTGDVSWVVLTVPGDKVDVDGDGRWMNARGWGSTRTRLRAAQQRMHIRSSSSEPIYTNSIAVISHTQSVEGKVAIYGMQGLVVSLQVDI